MPLVIRNGAKMNKKRLVELEVIRALAFVMIVVQHTIGGYSLEPKIPLKHAVLLRFIYTISKCSVPMFVFISGVSLFYTYKDSINVIDFYKKRVTTTILPYVICTFVYIWKNNVKVHNIIISLVNGDTVFHLWYMGMNIRIILTFPLVLFMFNRFRKPSKTFDLIFLVVISIISYKLIQDKDLIQSNISKYFTNKLSMNSRDALDLKQFISISPIFYMIYFVMGMYFVIYYDNLTNYILKYKNMIIIFFIALLIPRFLIIMHGDGNRISFHFSTTHETDIIIAYNICSIFFWYYFSLIIANVKNIVTDMLNVISYYSFTSYLYHVLIIDVISGILTLFYKVTVKNYIFPSIFYCITTIIFVTLLSKALTYVPFSKYIFGCTKYKDRSISISNKDKEKACLT